MAFGSALWTHWKFIAILLVVDVALVFGLNALLIGVLGLAVPPAAIVVASTLALIVVLPRVYTLGPPARPGTDPP